MGDSKEPMCDGPGEDWDVPEVIVSVDRSPVSDDSLSTAGRYIPLPPDGGWGWVIILASFLCNALVDGFTGSFGILMPSLTDHFSSGRGQTALANSVMVASFLIAGPFISVMVNAIGCRKVAITGSVISATSLILSTYSPDINVFILTYGFTAGVGLGMMYLPAAVMVGFYFERRRALATGLAYSGAGCGIVIMAPLTAALLEAYGWRGTLLIEAGVALQGAVLGALMRPLGPAGNRCPSSPDEVTDIVKEDSTPEKHPEVTSSLLGTLDEKKTGNVHVAAESEGRLRTYSAGARSADGSVQLYRKAIQNLMRARGPSDISVDSDDDHCEPANTVQSDPKINATADKTSDQWVPQGRMPTVTQSNYELTAQPILHNRNNPNVELKSIKEGRDYQNRGTVPTNYVSCHELTQDGIYQELPLKERENVKVELLKPLNRQDIFYSGSIHTLPEFQSQPDVVSYIASVTVIPQLHDDTDKTCAMNGLQGMLDVSLLGNSYFLIIALANFTIQLAYFIPIIYLTDYAASIGISTQNAATVISVIGISNALGRAAAGALANVPGVSVVHLNNMSLILCGLSTFLVTILCKSYVALILYAAFFGFTLAAFVPLSTIFLVKYLGLQKLTNSFGFLSMARGIASLVGAPMAGCLLDATGSFQYVFFVAGLLFVAAGLIHYLLPLVDKCEKRRTSSASQDQTVL